MNKMPAHIENEIRKNPNAVLTERGVVLIREGKLDELLIGLPNADQDYAEHFDAIRAEQAENLAIATGKPVETTSDEEDKDEDADETSGQDDTKSTDTTGDVDSTPAETPAETEQTPVSEQTPEDKEVAFEGTDDQRSVQEVSQVIVDANGGKTSEEILFDEAFAAAKKDPKYEGLDDEEIKRRVNLSLAAKARAAAKKATEANAAKEAAADKE
ncbi:hypothetical protein SHAb15599_00160 [Acinetobacter phage SH-Ab 15599]|nr:hypothetical protein SHAb15599_00160 [Acinetobacter phage SH-Ab 15599]